MEIKELYRLVKIITEIVSKHNFIASINQLRTSVTQYKSLKAVGQQNTQQQQQFQLTKTNIENARTSALNALNEILPKLNDYELVKSLNKVKLSSPYSEYAKNILTRIPNELETNIDGLISELTQYYQKVNAYQQFINTINSVLEDVSEESTGQQNDELILFFEGEANVSDLKELSRVSTEWNQIVNCFGRLTKENKTDIQIVSIERGSLVATLAVASVIIGGIISASDKVLNFILKIYEIKKKALELKQLKLDNIAKAIEILEKQSTVNLTNEAKIIVRELMQEYGWQVEEELYSETETAAIKGVKKIIKFQNSGGKIDCRLINPSDIEAESATKLKEKNIQFLKVEEEVRHLSEERQILQLEDVENSDDEESEV